MGRATTTRSSESMHLLVDILSYKRNTEIFGEDEPAELRYLQGHQRQRAHLQFLVMVAARSAGFICPATSSVCSFNEDYIFSAEAIADAENPGGRAQHADGACPTVMPPWVSELFALTTCELRRMHERILLLVKSAQERVASFLVEMSERAAAGNAIELPMQAKILPTIWG